MFCLYSSQVQARDRHGSLPAIEGQSIHTVNRLVPRVFRQGRESCCATNQPGSGTLCGRRQRRVEELHAGDVVDAAGGAGLGLREKRGGVCDVHVARDKVSLPIKLDELARHAAMTMACPRSRTNARAMPSPVVRWATLAAPKVT